MPHRILVVDTHPLHRLVVAEQLASLGHAASCAGDTDEAMSLLAAARFDMIVIACRMPDADGFALAACVQALARSRGERACPIVGYSQDVARDTPRAMESGMQACVPLPIPLPALDALLHTLLCGSEPARAARNIAQWDLFVATSREDLRLARECAQSGNVVQLRALFHRIKGAALMLGENDLAAACARAEIGCQEWGTPAILRAIDLVEALLDASAQWEPSR